MGKRMRQLPFPALALALGLLAAGCGGEQAGAVRIGVLAGCEGSFGNFASQIFAGAELPLLEHGARLAGPKPGDGVEGATVAGRDVELFFGCGDDSAEKALSEARRLVEVVGVDVLIGTQFIGESFALRDYARKQPAVTFVGGISLGQAATLEDSARNFFRFTTDAAQGMAGLGEYAYDKLGWRRVVTIGDQRSYSYTQTAGFVAEFCSLGGTVVQKIWVPLGARDLSPYTAEVPRSGVDGFLVTALPPTIPAFIEALPQLQGNLADRLIGSTLIFAEESLRERLAGVVFPAQDDLDSPAALDYRSEFGKAFPDLASSWAYFSVFYYAGMEAALRALEAVEGDLSHGQRRFQAALAEVELDVPTLGHIRLDERRQAIAPNYLIQYQQDEKGALVYKTIRKLENVEQTFNGYFSPGDPPPGKDTIECKHGNPPPWTRR